MLVLIIEALASFGVTLAITPFIRDSFSRLGFLDKPDSVRKLHGRPIPRVGGIAIFFAYFVCVATVFWFPWGEYYRRQLDSTSLDIPLLSVAISVTFALGLADDLKGLSAIPKLFVQTLAAVVAYVAGVHVNLIDSHSWFHALNGPLTIIWLVGCSNAFNMIDGLDGLAAGVGLFPAITIAYAALLQGNLVLALLTVPLVGCLLGFLRYNFNPASIFLGDGGSLFIGFLLGCYSAIWSEKSATLLGMTAPVMAIAVPLLDVGLSIARRFLRRKPIFEGDRGHIHHRLLARGLTPRSVALLLYGVCGVGAAFSLIQSSSYNHFARLILVLFCACVWIGIQYLGYVEFKVVGDLFTRGLFQRMVDARSRLAEFEQALVASSDVEQFWEQLSRGAKDFGFTGVRLNVRGRIYDSFSKLPGSTRFWQMRVPLPKEQYVNFQRTNVHSDEGDFEFVNIVERVLRLKLHTFEREVLMSVQLERKPMDATLGGVALTRI